MNKLENLPSGRCRPYLAGRLAMALKEDHTVMSATGSASVCPRVVGSTLGGPGGWCGAGERRGSLVRFSKHLAVAAVFALGGGMAVPGIAVAGAGPSWVVQPMHRIKNGILEGVSCSSAKACTAVGSNGGEATLAERWNGTKWALQHARTLDAGASCWGVLFVSQGLHRSRALRQEEVRGRANPRRALLMTATAHPEP